MVGEIAAVRHVDERIVAPVQNQRRRGDRGENLSRVDSQRPQPITRAPRFSWEGRPPRDTSYPPLAERRLQVVPQVLGVLAPHAQPHEPLRQVLLTRRRGAVLDQGLDAA